MLFDFLLRSGDRVWLDVVNAFLFIILFLICVHALNFWAKSWLTKRVFVIQFALSINGWRLLISLICLIIWLLWDVHVLLMDIILCGTLKIDVCGFSLKLSYGFWKYFCHRYIGVVLLISFNFDGWKLKNKNFFGNQVDSFRWHVGGSNLSCFEGLTELMWARDQVDLQFLLCDGAREQ